MGATNKTPKPLSICRFTIRKIQAQTISHAAWSTRILRVALPAQNEDRACQVIGTELYVHKAASISLVAISEVDRLFKHSFPCPLLLVGVPEVPGEDANNADDQDVRAHGDPDRCHVPRGFAPSDNKASGDSSEAIARGDRRCECCSFPLACLTRQLVKC